MLEAVKRECRDREAGGHLACQVEIRTLALLFHSQLFKSAAMEYVYAFIVIVGSMITVGEMLKRVPQWYSARKTRIDISRIEHDLFD